MLPIFLLGVLTFVSSVVNAQSVVWDTQVEGSNTFSSPRAIDLTGDGVPDVVIGCGRELADTSFGVFAFDGVNGEVLWSTKTRSQMFGSPIFNDVSGDGTPDAVIGGRRSQFYCIDGATGDILWESYECSQFPNCFSDSLPNFYTGQWLPDLNGDNIPEIVNIRGGFAPADANDFDRPPGNIVIVDGATGAVLREYEMPDGKESYSSPVLWRDNTDDVMVVFGSGGETVGGSLWAATITSLWDGSPEFIALAASESKGFMSPVSIADMDGDGFLDLITLSFDGRATVIRGADRAVLWSVNPFPNNESSSVPALLQFDEDGIPDVAINFATGVFPFYSGGFNAVLSGLDGSVLWQSDPSAFPFHSAVAFRSELSTTDKLLILRNQIGTGNQLIMEMVGALGVNEILLFETGSVNLASTPLLLDFEGDGTLSIVVVSTTHPNNPFSEDNMRVRRLSTEISMDADQITWGGYMGTNGDGMLMDGLSFSVSSDSYFNQPNTLKAFPNPFKDKIFVQSDFVNGHFMLTDVSGRTLATGVFEDEIDFSTFSCPFGTYFLHLSSSGGNNTSVLRVVRNP